jgi:hypothetical protein
MIPFIGYELESGSVPAHIGLGSDPIREFGRWVNWAGGWPLLGHA